MQGRPGDAPPVAWRAATAHWPCLHGAQHCGAPHSPALQYACARSAHVPPTATTMHWWHSLTQPPHINTGWAFAPSCADWPASWPDLAAGLLRSRCASCTRFWISCISCKGKGGGAGIALSNSCISCRAGGVGWGGVHRVHVKAQMPASPPASALSLSTLHTKLPAHAP